MSQGGLQVNSDLHSYMYLSLSINPDLKRLCYIYSPHLLGENQQSWSFSHIQNNFLNI